MTRLTLAAALLLAMPVAAQVPNPIAPPDNPLGAAVNPLGAEPVPHDPIAGHYVGPKFTLPLRWVAGIMQGLMWREYGDDGYLVYAFSEVVSAMFPMYLIRAAGGVLYLAGAVIMVVNIWMTIAGRLRAEKPMTETPYDPASDKPLVAVPAE